MNVTRLKLPAFRRFVESSAWAIHPERGGALLELLEARAHGDRGVDLASMRAAVDTERAEREARAGDRRPVTKSGGAIAVLPMYGVIAQRMDLMMAYCGGTSTEAFADAFDAAMADPNVSAIVIDCDSPGGSVTGTPELAKRIFKARGQGKQIVAVANGLMASAAYWICSAADEVVATPSGEVGSIGVFMVHVDQSAADEMMGLKYTLIKAGEHKAETNPWEPLSDDAHAFLQSQVDEANGMFVAAVAQQRGVDAKTVNADYGQGRCFTAKQALAAGMVNRVATLEETLRRLGAKNVGASGRPVQALGTTVIGADRLGNGMVARTAETTTLTLRAGKSDDDGFTDDGEDDDTPFCASCGAEMDDDDTECKACGAKATKKTSKNADDDGTGGDGEDEDDEVASSKSNALVIGDLTRLAASLGDPRVTQLRRGTIPRIKRAPMKESLPTAAGAAPGTDTPPPDSHSASAEEPTMQAQDDAVKAALEAERKRVTDIRTLGKDYTSHGITATEIDAAIDGGMSYDQATAHFLAKIRADHRANPTIRVGAPRETEKPFASLGENLHAIIKYERSSGRVVDPRLLPQAAASGMSEGVPSDGGFAIQPDFATEIIARSYQMGEILSRVRKVPISATSNGLKINAIDETSRTDGNRYGGIQVVWAAEADQAQAKKPKLRQIELSLKKLIASWFLTDELADDTVAMSAIATEGFSEEVTFVTEDAIINGNGVGKPFGILNAAAVVQVAKESGQTATTFVTANAAKMFGRIWNRSLPNAIWLVNQDVWQQLLQLTLGAAGSTTQFPVFLPPGGVSATPYGLLYGKPVVPVEYCQTLGTAGDVILADLSQYLLIDKGGPKQAQSIHVKFLTDELAFRITYRVDGQPIWNKALTPKNGTNTVSPYITCQGR